MMKAKALNIANIYVPMKRRTHWTSPRLKRSLRAYSRAARQHRSSFVKTASGSF
jgi:hypothetical protein